MTEKEKRIFKLLDTPRMSLHPLEEPNYLRGLYQLIKENFNPDFEVIEIGTYEGLSALLFSETCKSIITVDPYDSGYLFEQESKEDLIRAEKIAIKRLKDLSNVRMIKMTSENFCKSFDKKVDCVYFDGDHTEKGIRKDIEIWKSKIKKGGLLAGHDYSCPEIEKVINEMFGGYDEKYDDSSWIIEL